MKEDWQLTEEDFNRFLGWLDADRDKAAQTYEKMRRNLITLFNKRGCHLSEDLADESFDRVIRRLPKMPDCQKVVPAAYIITVAKNLYLEFVVERSKKAPLPETDRSDLQSPAPGNSGDFDDRVFDCLEECLGKLPPESRRLIVDYYLHSKRAKIDNRKKIAEEWGLSFNALRIRAHRIRDSLRQCLDQCLERESHG
jgi:RNA polymerase sigma factor (sigma-70 family)